MPGIEFRPGGPPKYHPPPRGFKEGLRALGDASMGFVVLHHAAAAWPTWPEWARFVGAQFLYSPRKSFGEALPDSGYLLEVTHRVSPLIEHPVTQGIEPFTLTDELYLWPGPQEPVTPIFASDFSFEYQNFYSAARALEGHLFFARELDTSTRQQSRRLDQDLQTKPRGVPAVRRWPLGLRGCELPKTARQRDCLGELSGRPRLGERCELLGDHPHPGGAGDACVAPTLRPASSMTSAFALWNGGGAGPVVIPASTTSVWPVT